MRAGVVASSTHHILPGSNPLIPNLPLAQQTPISIYAYWRRSMCLQRRWVLYASNGMFLSFL
jgi:hypothetical protein